MSLPWHWTTEMVDCVPTVEKGLCLDFGCGEGQSKEMIETRGYEWLGIDIAKSARTSLVADGHKLPFRHGSFDLVVSVAVLEHLCNQFVAATEISRVLKPEGVFLGTVAFLEPFHDNSYFHMTHLGLRRTLEVGGFRVERIWPGWHVLEAQIPQLIMVSRIPVVRAIVSCAIKLSGQALMSIRAFTGKCYRFVKVRDNDERSKRDQRFIEEDRMKFAGSLCFLAQNGRTQRT